MYNFNNIALKSKMFNFHLLKSNIIHSLLSDTRIEI